MLCSEFENQLTDYLDGALPPEAHKAFAAHALRCPVCHDTLSEVKNTMQACRADSVSAPSQDLDARILISTMPETAMSCEDFEEFLTDYLDGFLPAPLFHRWERHALLCEHCTELPGEVVRTIGVCNVYRADEQAVPVGLNERILQATLTTELSREIRASFGERIASWLRIWLDPIVSPQLATVATMLLVAVFVLTNTVSADGSISGVYTASIQLAERSAGSNGGIKEITKGLKELVGGQRDGAGSDGPQKPQPKQGGSSTRGRQNKS